MAVPVYTNDLTTRAIGDEDYDIAQGGEWNESGDAGWDTEGAMVDDLNLWYTDNKLETSEAASSCVSAQYTKDGTGSGTTGPGTILHHHATAFTVPTNGAVLVHSLWAAPPALNVYEGTFLTAEAGVSVLIGSTFDDFDVHYVSGSNKAPSPEGGWATYAVDPTITPAGTVGTVTALNTVGTAIAADAQARGNPQAVQAIRFGRCEVIYTAGDSTTPATFEGYAVIDNAPKDRFNLFKYTDSGYKSRGLMTFGTATTAVYFEDSDVSIVIADDPKVSSAFNAGVVNNTSSVLKWTNISIKNLSSVAKYTFTVNNDATTEKNGGVFEDLGTFTYGTNSTQNNVTYRRQEIVQGGTCNSCTFDKAIGTSAAVSTTFDNFNSCVFASNGVGHAVDISATEITVNSSMDWDNTSSDYTDVDGNQTLKVNVASGVTLTIYNNTGDTLYYKNTGLGTVSIQTAAVPVKVTVKVGGSAVFGASVYLKLIAGDGGTVILNGETDSNGEISTSYGGATPVAVDSDISEVRSSSGSTPYQNYTLSGQITLSGYDVSAILIED